jgi:hypothetical protein
MVQKGAAGGSAQGAGTDCGVTVFTNDWRPPSTPTTVTDFCRIRHFPDTRWYH